MGFRSRLHSNNIIERIAVHAVEMWLSTHVLSPQSTVIEGRIAFFLKLSQFAIRLTYPMFKVFVLEGPSNFDPQFLDFRPLRGLSFLSELLPAQPGHLETHAPR